MHEKDIKLSEYESKLETLKKELLFYKDKFQKSEQEIMRLSKTLDSLKDQLKTHEEQRRELEQLNDQWESSKRYLEYTKQELEERLYQAEECAILIKNELEEISIQKEIEIQRLKDEIKDLKQEISLLNTSASTGKIQELESALSKALKDQKEFEEKYKLAKPRKSEQIQESAVRVIVKVRPFLDWDIKPVPCLICTDSEIQVESKKVGSAKCFMFERVLGPECTLEELFDDLQTGIDYASDGGNACILAYGQTGSGKTFTMNGVISKAMEFMKARFDGKSVLASLQIIEVYNEHVRNLLTNDGLSKNWKDIVNAAEVQLGVNWIAKAQELIKKSCCRRTTKSTDANELSSRSHCIYTLRFSSKSGQGRIQFVDLAGSERLNKSKVSGETLKETLHINKSLSALQDVITALETKSEHIPYRNSVLTRILQPTLGGDASRVSVILACSPCEDSVNETLCTLSLGTRIKSVDLCWALRKNIKSLEVERTLSLLEKERSEKLALVRKLEKIERDYSNFQLAMKEKDLRIASMSVIIQQTEKKYVEQRESYKREIQEMKTRSVDERKKSFDSASGSVSESASLIITPRNEETKVKPVVGLPLNSEINKMSSCKNFKILDTSKRFISSSPTNNKKNLVVPKVGKSQTPSRTQKPLIVKNGKQIVVKSKP
jgi:kinesin family protein C2/C3